MYMILLPDKNKFKLGKIRYVTFTDGRKRKRLPKNLDTCKACGLLRGVDCHV